MGDAAGSASEARPKKARSRATAAPERIGFRERVVERLNAFEDPAPKAKGKAKPRTTSGSTSSLARSTATRNSPPRSPAATRGRPQSAKQTRDAPRPAYLKSVTVEGFRGIGKPATLDLPPGPGLTLVIGRNGSGKSSFAEALELLLTGDTFRWKEKRSKVWKEGWRNLHHPNGGDRSRVRPRRRKGARVDQAPVGGRRDPRKLHDQRAGPGQAEDGLHRARMDGAAGQLPALPFL